MRQKHELRCVIAAGGTAGHVLPALAVAEALRDRGARVTFASASESRLTAEAGFATDVFEVSGVPREVSGRAAIAAARAFVAPIPCLRILRHRRPGVVLGGGGYVAGPMIAAAGLLRIPAAAMEADAHLGLANRLAAPFAQRVFLAYPLEGRNGAKYRVVGRPIPKRSLAAAGGQLEARQAFGLPEGEPVLLVVGGSQGARALNEAAIAAYGEDGSAVLHLCGERDFESLAARVTRPGYRLVAFTTEFGAALASCDLVVSRSGGVVWEIAAAGRPALLVPYPYATADHQTKNARWFEHGGGAVVVPEPRLDLRRQVDALLADRLRLARMGEAMLALARPDAADTVAEELIALAAARR
jgi:UDP-N-acetylglucosamine--N-acetylmuramyl-(pentapeptide) pyrophosphoryl-undecaprenol N-acetylglucosamine transferase